MRHQKYDMLLSRQAGEDFDNSSVIVRSSPFEFWYFEVGSLLRGNRHDHGYGLALFKKESNPF